MKQLTKIIVNSNNCLIYHSTEIIDKKEEYAVKFKGMYNGYIDWCIKKSNIGSYLNGQLQVILYIPTSKFNNNKDEIIKSILEIHHDKYGKYKWYKKPIVKEFI